MFSAETAVGAHPVAAVQITILLVRGRRVVEEALWVALHHPAHGTFAEHADTVEQHDAPGLGVGLLHVWKGTNPYPASPIRKALRARRSHSAIGIWSRAWRI